jgi:hypothetical protein
MESCSICLESIKKKSFITPCCHFFHKGCLTRWLKKSKTCPNCRTELSFQGRGKNFEFLDTNVNENQNLSNIYNTNLTTTLIDPERSHLEDIMTDNMLLFNTIATTHHYTVVGTIPNEGLPSLNYSSDLYRLYTSG